MSDFTVRPAVTQDIPALGALDPWPSAASWESRIRDGAVLVLTRDGSRALGLVRWSALWTTVPFLELIVIAPEARGQGGSHRLLGALFEDLRRRGFAALLSSSQTDEPGAARWHRHMGFVSNGVIENIADDGIGELVWRRML